MKESPDAALELPNEKHKQSFIEAVGEFQADSENTNSGSMGRYRDMAIDELRRDFPSYLRKLRDAAAGRNLGEGIVPESTFWLIEGGEFVGRVSVRHYLNENLARVGGHIGYEVRPSRRRRGYGKLLLKSGLDKAWDLGIEKALVTCDDSNTASLKIIQSCGGVQDVEVSQGSGRPSKLRFWIDLNERQMRRT